jgi:hypothetical protein
MRGVKRTQVDLPRGLAITHRIRGEQRALSGLSGATSQGKAVSFNKLTRPTTPAAFARVEVAKWSTRPK